MVIIPEKTIFAETLEIMGPEECLRVMGDSFPPRGSKEVITLDLSTFVPMEYVMAYGRGTIRQNGLQPRPHPLRFDTYVIDVELERGTGPFDMPEPMVSRGEGKIGDHEVQLLNMAFAELYIVKPVP